MKAFFTLLGSLPWWVWLLIGAVVLIVVVLLVIASVVKALDEADRMRREMEDDYEQDSAKDIEERLK